jgi:dephospho-CoA kinase
MPYTKLIVGLTGGIGSGKSTVADLFAERGITIIDTDILAREVISEETPAFKTLVDYFGSDIVTANGSLDRRALRHLVFANPEKRTWLENLLHPLIREAIKKQIDVSTSAYCIVVIPLLFETKPNPVINRILVVDTPEELQLQRAISRDQQTPLQIKNIMLTQVTREHRLAGADDVIINDKSPEHLIPQVEALHNFYLTLVEKPNQYI